MHARTIRLAAPLLLLALLALPTTARAAPAITIVPAAGAAGTQFVVTGTGFPAGAALNLLVVDPAGVVVFTDRTTVDAAGRFEYRLSTPEEVEPGTYRLVVASAPFDKLAEATFAITAPPGGRPGRPTLAVAPAWGPPGTHFALAGAGLPAGETLHYGIVRPAAERFTVLGSARVSPDGSFAAAIDSSGLAPGQYGAFVGRGAPGPETPPLAGAGFLVTFPAGAGGRSLAVAPPAGPAGTAFTVSGAGFPAGERVLVAAIPEAGPGTGARRPSEVQVAPDGTFTARLDSTGSRPGRYLPLVVPTTEGGEGFATAEVTFTVTGEVPPPAPPGPVPPPPGSGGALPGLPNTGAGGGSHAPPLALGGLGLAVSCGAGALLVRRRAT